MAPFIHSIENTTFVNFEDNDTREAGAISYLLYTSFGMSVENSAEGLEFINAKPVHFPARKRNSLSAMDEGSWVVFELPGFTTAAEGA